MKQHSPFDLVRRANFSRSSLACGSGAASQAIQRARGHPWIRGIASPLAPMEAAEAVLPDGAAESSAAATN
jgi:hypothetical protein